MLQTAWAVFYLALPPRGFLFQKSSVVLDCSLKSIIYFLYSIFDENLVKVVLEKYCFNSFRLFDRYIIILGFEQREDLTPPAAKRYFIPCFFLISDNLHGVKHRSRSIGKA